MKSVLKRFFSLILSEVESLPRIEFVARLNNREEMENAITYTFDYTRGNPAHPARWQCFFYLSKNRVTAHDVMLRAGKKPLAKPTAMIAAYIGLDPAWGSIRKDLRFQNC